MKLDLVKAPFDSVICEGDITYEDCINIDKFNGSIYNIVTGEDKFFNTETDTKWVLFRHNFIFKENKVYSKDKQILIKFNWNGNRLSINPKWNNSNRKEKEIYITAIRCFPSRFDCYVKNKLIDRHFIDTFFINEIVNNEW